MDESLDTVTRLLQAAGQGDRLAAERLLPAVYDELRKLARARLARTPPGNTLQPTALVHEAYMRVVGGEDPGWDHRGHFFAAAAQAMRDILVEQARRKAALKHGGGRKRVEADESDLRLDAPATDMLALDEALKRLATEDEVDHQIVMLRFFAGLTSEQIGQALDISGRTVERRWRYIRARLHKELGADSIEDSAGE